MRTDWRKEIFAYCEELEAEAACIEANPESTEHEVGFARGQRTTAKRIRREAGEIFRRREH